MPASKCPAPATALTPFLESDVVLGDVDEHFAGNYLDEATILKLARDKGYSTASIGKIGPALIFDPTERTGKQTILVDDATGTPKGIPLSRRSDQPAAGGEPAARGAVAAAPTASAGNVTTPGTLTRQCRAAGLFRGGHDAEPCCRCSRTATSRSCWCSGRAIPTAASTIRATASTRWFPASTARPRSPQSAMRTTISARIRSALKDLGLLDSTDIIVTADHGFSTISKESQTSSTVKTKFADALPGHLPLGFVALDLAHALEMPLLDPDDGYKTIGDGQHTQVRQRPDRRRPQQAEGRGCRQWRVGSDLHPRRRQGDGQADRRCAA